MAALPTIDLPLSSRLRGTFGLGRLRLGLLATASLFVFFLSWDRLIARPASIAHRSPSFHRCAYPSPASARETVGPSRQYDAQLPRCAEQVRPNAAAVFANHVCFLASPPKRSSSALLRGSAPPSDLFGAFARRPIRVLLVYPGLKRAPSFRPNAPPGAKSAPQFYGAGAPIHTVHCYTHALRDAYRGPLGRLELGRFT